MVDTPLQSFFGPGKVHWTGVDGALRELDTFDLNSATPYAVLAGLADDMPDADLAWARWHGEIRTGAISGGVLTYLWPAAGSEESVNRTSVLLAPATANCQIAVETITDVAILDRGQHRRRIVMMVRNTLAPSLVVSLAPAAAGRIPLRYAAGTGDLTIPFGETGVFEIDIMPTFGLVREAYLAGADVPSMIAFVQSGGGASPTTTTFQPVLRRLHDPVVVVAHRTTGTAITKPSGKGYVWPDTAELTAGVHAFGGGAMLVGLSEDHTADGVFDNIGSFTNANAARALAMRGCDILAVHVNSGVGTTLAWEQLASLPAGARIATFTLHNVNLGTPARPSILDADDNPVLLTFERTSNAGWSYEIAITPVIEKFEPPAVTLPSAVAWATVTVVYQPAG